MANEPTITMTGNLVSDPELRYTPSGTAVANFTVANTPRFLQDGAWQDGDPLFLRCTVWREYAENVAKSLGKGDRVVVFGRLRATYYETKDGEKRTSFECDVDEVGPALRFATADPEKRRKDPEPKGKRNKR